MDWGSCEDPAECDRAQCWNGDFIKKTLNCETPDGEVVPHLTSAVVGSDFCRCMVRISPAHTALP